MLRKSELTLFLQEKVFPVSFLILVFASYLSISLSYLAQFIILLTITALCLLGKTPFSPIQLKKLPASLYALFFFWIFIVLSVLNNYSSYDRPLRTIVRSHYFIVSILLSLILPTLFWNFKNRSKLYKKASFALLFSLAVGSLYGIIAWTLKWDFFRHITYDPYRRVSGAFGVSSSYANSAVIGLAVGLWLCFSAYKTLALSPKERLIWGFLTLIGIVGVYLSYTRSALLALLCALPILFSNFSKRLSVLFVSILILSIGSAVYYGKQGGIEEKNRYFQSLESLSNSTRLTQFQIALFMFNEKPITGVGFRKFEELDPSYKEKYQLPNKYFIGNAHNNYLEVLSTMGIFGLFSYLLWMLLWLYELTLLKTPYRELGIGLWIIFQVAGLFHSNIIDAESLTNLTILYALSSSYIIYQRRNLLER